MEDTNLLPASIVSDTSAKVFEQDEFNKKLIDYVASSINKAANEGRFTCDIALSNAVTDAPDALAKLSKVMGNLADYMTYTGYLVAGMELSTRVIRISWANPRV